MDIVTVTINGRERRFIREKLEKYLQSNQIPEFSGVRIPKLAEPKEKKKQKSAYQRVEKRKIRTDFTRKGNPVTVTGPDGKKETFMSLSAAARETKVSKSQISKILNKGAKTNSGYSFEIKIQ